MTARALARRAPPSSTPSAVRWLASRSRARRSCSQTPGVADAPGPALVFGTSHRTSALDAALINGTASHALDYDDVSGVLGGHHSAPVTAPIFALGEQLKVSGKRALAAYIIGVETEVRLSRAVNFHHYDKGWHPTATLGTFGAAASAAHLLGLDVARTAKALALAASFSCGLKANFGTMTKPLHVGHVGRNGLFAALIAERGFESQPRRARAQAGLARGLQRRGHLLPERMFENWGSPWEIETAENGLKQFPCCGSTHPAIAMMLALVREEGVKADAVEGIEILAHRRRLPHTNNPDPRTPLGRQVLDPVLHRPRARRRRGALARLRGRRGDGGAGAPLAAADHDSRPSRHARRQPQAVRRRGGGHHEGRPAAVAPHRPSRLPRRRQPNVDRGAVREVRGLRGPRRSPTTRSRPCSSASRRWRRSPTSTR